MQRKCIPYIVDQIENLEQKNIPLLTNYMKQSPS
jgi:hypothetical protein